MAIEMMEVSSHVRQPRTSPAPKPTHSRRSLLSLALLSYRIVMASALDNGLRRSVPSVPLKYSIAAASEHSGVYVAPNILRDEPADSTSRWSGASQIPHVKQWVTLRLDNLAVLSLVPFIPLPLPSLGESFRADRVTESITFGKVRDSFDRARFPKLATFRKVAGHVHELTVAFSSFTNVSPLRIRKRSHLDIRQPTRVI
jgi:hypothetical protein